MASTSPHIPSAEAVRMALAFAQIAAPALTVQRALAGAYTFPAPQPRSIHDPLTTSTQELTDHD